MNPPANRNTGGSEILRAPNLLTVPGDPLVGYLLAAPDASLLSPDLFGAVLACLAFYSGGLLSHVLLGPEAPRSERRTTMVVAALLFATGVALCVLLGQQARLVGMALLFSILLYNIGAKQHPLLGAMIMGLCRGFGLLLGAAATPAGDWLSPPPTLAFDVVVIYVASITHLAHREMAHGPILMERWTPAFVLAAAYALLLRLQAPESLLECVVLSGSLLIGGFIALVVADTLDVAAARRRPEHPGVAWAVQGTISLLFGGLLFLQAGMAIISGAGLAGQVVAMTLLALWPLHRALSRRVPGEAAP
jgi:hypothetical protein